MTTSGALWSAEEAAAATGGQATGQWIASGVSIDTRTLSKGDLFVALQGEARDGHGFVAPALDKGAAAAMISRHPEGVQAGAPLLRVSDTQAGLEALGRASRARSRSRIVAVTGSAGKTTTKEMLHLSLARCGKVAASAASYNNHWGVPLSLARMPRDAAYGVFEIGMNHAGEIRALVKQVRPHVAVITTVVAAHLEYFGTVEAIADAKAEIFEGLEPGGTAILPADNPQFERLKQHARACGVEKIMSFGAQRGADARLVSTESQGSGQFVTADIAGTQIRFVLGAPGAHIAMNALAALTAVRELGADGTIASAALAEFAALKGRGARFSAAGIDVIDESYNANPGSMAAALTLLRQAPATPSARRIAVLGDMLELGPQSAALHRALARELATARADAVFLCGREMRALWDAIPRSAQGAYAETSTELVQELMRTLRAGDVVLVKGSFGSRMSVIIDALKAREAAKA